MQENNENTETDDDKEDFKNAIRCFLCGDRSENSYKTGKQTGKYQKVRDKGQSPSSYPSEKYQKVRDHCHATDRYRECDRSICTSYSCHNHSKNPRVFFTIKNI